MLCFEQFLCIKMSTEEISAEGTRKRKAVYEDVGFPPSLKPINTRRLSSCTDNKDLKPDLDKNIASNCIDVGEDEGCETPKSEEHQIPKVLSCPRAPKKPRATATRRKSENFFHISSRDLNLLFGDPSQPKRKKFQVR